MPRPTIRGSFTDNDSSGLERAGAAESDAQGSHDTARIHHRPDRPGPHPGGPKWLGPLADRRIDSAQVIFGELYRWGQGVSHDYVTAHMWLNLAAARGNDAAREARDLVAENTPIAEIAEAQRRALEWQPMPER